MPTTKTNKSYRHGVYPEDQGVGIIENTGTAWVKPWSRVGGLTIQDSKGEISTLILDFASGYYYNITTRDGPYGSGIEAAVKDKMTTAGAGGTNVASSITLREDRASLEANTLRDKITHVYLRPKSEADGYDADLEVDLDIYVDGEPTTASAHAEDIPLNGDIAYDKVVEGHRLQRKISTNLGKHLLVGIDVEEVSRDIPAEPADLELTEDDYQEEFAEPDLWAVLNSVGNTINRVTGSAISITYTAATGPDDQTSGMTIAAATTLSSTTLTGSGTLLIWHNGAITVTIGGVAIVLTTHDTSGSWTLSYANTLTASGSLVITPTTTAIISDIRTYDSAITAAARGYYYDDVVDNDGGIMIPRD